MQIYIIKLLIFKAFSINNFIGNDKVSQHGNLDDIVELFDFMNSYFMQHHKEIINSIPDAEMSAKFKNTML